MTSTCSDNWSNYRFPQWFQVDLGAALTVGRVVLKLPPSLGARARTLAITGSTNGSTFTTLCAATGRACNPGSGDTVTVTSTSTRTRYLRVTATANTG